MTDQLKMLLKSADPAAGDPGISRPEAARMKHEVLDAQDLRTPVMTWIPVAAGSALALLVAAVVLFMDLPRGTDPTESGLQSLNDTNIAAPELTAGSPAANPARKTVRRIDFVTRGGTRIIWTLDPDFDV